MPPHTPHPDATASALQVLGEALMDCFEEPDGRLHPRMGGSPFNLARAAARQGRAVRWLTPFSTDAFGQTLRRQALADGIHPDVPASPWPTALAVVSFEGENARYGFYREGIADRDWSAVSLLSALTDQPPGVLHTGSLMLVPPQHEATLAVMEALAARGWTISLDINLRPRLAADLGAYRAAVWAALARAHWVKASDEDLAVLMDLPAPRRWTRRRPCGRLQQPTHRRGALTFGAQGAWLTRGDAAPPCRPGRRRWWTRWARATPSGAPACLADWLEDAPRPRCRRERVEATLRRALRAAALNCAAPAASPHPGRAGRHRGLISRPSPGPGAAPA
jgi:fructokinase